MKNLLKLKKEHEGMKRNDRGDKKRRLPMLMGNILLDKNMKRKVISVISMMLKVSELRIGFKKVRKKEFNMS